MTKKNNYLREEEEIKRIEYLIQGVRQQRQRLTELCSHFGREKDFYIEVKASILQTKSTLAGLDRQYKIELDEDRTGLINISETTRIIHEELQKEYRDDVEFYRELLDTIDFRIETAKIKSTPTVSKNASSLSPKPFEDYVLLTSIPCNALKNELQTLSKKGQFEKIVERINEEEDKGSVIIRSKQFKGFLQSFWFEPLKSKDYDNTLQKRNKLKYN